MDMASSASAGKPASGGMASIKFGVFSNPGSHAGKSISQVRAEQGKLWGVPTDAAAHVGKTAVSEDYVIQEGDNVEFHRRAGEKG